MKLQTIVQMSRAMVAAALLLGLAGIAAAQDEGHRWTGNLGAGYTPVLGALNKRLDNGWNVAFGAGYHFTSRFSVSIEGMYNGLSVSRGVLNELSVPNGDAHVWSVTLDPKLTFRSRRHVTPYIVGGIGYYRRTVEFTQPTTAAVTVFDPFFGFFPALVPADQVIGRITRDGIGGNAGLGFEIPLERFGNTKLFAEARYHYANNGGLATRLLPFTIGLRF